MMTPLVFRNTQQDKHNNAHLVSETTEQDKHKNAHLV